MSSPKDQKDAKGCLDNFNVIISIIVGIIGIISFFGVKQITDVYRNPGSPTEPPGLTDSPSILTNYLRVSVNGEEKTYQVDYFGFSSVGGSWVTTLKSNKYDNRDTITIWLPADVAPGAVIPIRPPKDPLEALNNIGNKSITYVDSRGESFDVGSDPGHTFTIKITKWEGRGGIAAGTLEGTVQQTPVDTLVFTKGEFQIRIEDLK